MPVLAETLRDGHASDYKKLGEAHGKSHRKAD